MPDLLEAVVSFIPLGTGLVLQYLLLIALYWFLYKVVRLIYRDLYDDKTDENRQDSASLTVIASESGLNMRRYQFTDLITIGRNRDNDIVLSDSYISHYHARIRRKGQTYLLSDLDSRNRTYINDEEITGETVLESGDHIRLGMVVLKFER